MSRETAISHHDGKAQRYEVFNVATNDIKPSPENIELYGDIDFNSDPALPMLKRSIAVKGLGEPLILTRDNFILSGHRRFHIVSILGWRTVPCRFVDIWRSKAKDFHRLLAEFNPQRVKSVASILAEDFLLGKKSQQRVKSWAEYEKATSSEIVATMAVAGAKSAEAVGERRAEFLAAAKKVVFELEEYWPLSVRQIHYGLLNDPPLTQTTSERNERWRYRNDLACYGKLSDLLTLARYQSEIPWHAIADLTRETREFSGSRNLSEFIQAEARTFLNDYKRQRLEGQPHHVEVLLEKNTLLPLVQDICENFHIPFTPLRGYGGPSVWREIEMRWRKKLDAKPNAKCRLVIISDHDPEGLNLADDAIRSLRDKHHVKVEAIRAGVTWQQIQKFRLPPNPAKESSARYAEYVKRTGTNKTWECESLKPEVLRRALHDSILSVLDVKQLAAVEKLERDEQAQLERIRERIRPALTKVLFNGEL
jgi:hypothetical protein